MHADRLAADEQLRTDLAVASALGNKLQDLLFAWRQDVVELRAGAMPPCRERGAKLGEQEVTPLGPV